MQNLVEIGHFIGLHWLALLGGIATLIKGLQIIFSILLLLKPKSIFLLKIKSALDDMANNLPSSEPPPVIGMPIIAGAPLPPKGFVRIGTSLFLCVAIGLVGCFHVPVSTLAGQLLNCADQGIQSQLPAYVGQASDILNGQNPNWQNTLDSLKLSGGVAVVCAVEQIVNDLEHSANRGPVSEVAMIRGEVWLHTQAVK